MIFQIFFWTFIIMFICQDLILLSSYKMFTHELQSTSSEMMTEFLKTKNWLFRYNSFGTYRFFQTNFERVPEETITKFRFYKYTYLISRGLNIALGLGVLILFIWG